jgi:hypothetical protein
MKITTVFLMIALLVSASSCYKSSRNALSGADGDAVVQTAPQASPAAIPAISGEMQQGQQGQREAKAEVVKLDNAVNVQSPVVPLDRKIIRNGDLAIELDDPDDAQRKISAIAESLGGFVVTSDSQHSESNGTKARLAVSMIVRVPSLKFEEAMQRIRGVGSGARILRDKRTGQDVTEEFIDLEARIRTKKALETQFMEIMKRAQKISDALEVQSQLAEVRGEIEQLEGRRRFLENQSSLSTITIQLQMPAPLVASAPSGFWHSVREALGDGLTGATEIVLGFIRLALLLLPILVVTVPPAWLVWRFVLRRFAKDWFRKPETAASSTQI